MLLLNTEHTPGYRIIEAKGLVSGNAVLGTGYLKQFLAGFRAVFGGEIKSYQRVSEVMCHGTMLR